MKITVYVTTDKHTTGKNVLEQGRDSTTYSKPTFSFNRTRRGLETDTVSRTRTRTRATFSSGTESYCGLV